MKKLLFTLMLLVATTATMSAYDFEVDGIYYNRLIGNKAEVTYKNVNYASYSGEVVIPETVRYGNTDYIVTNIGDKAFYACVDLTSITIPSTITSIGEIAFHQCSSLTQVKIADLAAWCRIQFHGEYTSNPLQCAHHLYLNGEEITDLVIPDSIQTIPYRAFAGCAGLNSVTISNSVTTIGKSSFRNCTALTSVIIGDAVTIIEPAAFCDCISLKNFTYGSSVTTIGNCAFMGCSSLTSMIIPSTVTSIGLQILSDTPNLEMLAVDSDNPVYDSRGNCNAIINTANNTLIQGIKNTIIPNTVTKIGESAFYYCKSLENIIIPSSVIGIAKYAFYECRGLKSILFETSAINVGQYAFWNCSNLERVDIIDLAGWCSSNFHGTAANPLNEAHYLFLNGQEVQDLIIPESVTKIGESAFKNCLSLTSITFHNAITNIYESAFSGCKNLTSVSLPNSLTTINNDLFSYCSNLSSVTIPNSVSVIYNDAFAGCSSLTDLTLSNSITAIYSGAFYGCSSLNNIDIPSSLCSMGEDAFRNCTSLTKVNISDLAAWCNLTIDGVFSNPLYYAKHLYLNNEEVRDLVIPNTVQEIKDNVFSNCKGLTSVTIPNSVTTIGIAFDGCTNLRRITCQSVTPPNSTYDSFGCYDSTYDIPIFVPQESLEAYRAHSGWNRFRHIVPFIGAGPGDVNGDGNIAIGDVTGLIDMLLAGEELPAYVDVNGDGMVTIADVTALIDMLLGGNN